MRESRRGPCGGVSEHGPHWLVCLDPAAATDAVRVSRPFVLVTSEVKALSVWPTSRPFSLF